RQRSRNNTAPRTMHPLRRHGVTSWTRHVLPSLHAAPVLSPDFEQRVGDLAERAHPYRVHELGEHVAAFDDGLLEFGQRDRGLARMALMKVAQAHELRLLFFLSRARELELLRHDVRFRTAERVDADDRIRAVVLPVLVVERFLLDLAALIARLH